MKYKTLNFIYFVQFIKSKFINFLIKILLLILPKIDRKKLVDIGKKKIYMYSRKRI